jgi:putative protein-disulfide isomerase
MLEESLAPDIPLRLWPGALFPEPVPIEAGMRAHILEADQRIHEMTGAQFGAAYNARIGDPACAIKLWSVPPIAALGAVPVERQLDFLELLQRAHYVGGHDLSDPATLAQLAATAGLDETAFSATLKTADHGKSVGEWIGQARALMAQAGISGFPGYVLETGQRLYRLDHTAAYENPADFIAQVEALAEQDGNG